MAADAGGAVLSNAGRGSAFQLRAQAAVSKLLAVALHLEVAVPVGNPPKLHTFDLGSPDRSWIGEVKAFTWTASGNTPSAKITTLREAAQYLRLLPEATRTVIVLMEDLHPRTAESLAHYFARLNDHLLGPVAIFELSTDDTTVKIIRHGAFRA